jgi:hypothetical protein
MHIIPHNLLSLDIPPTGEEQVVEEEPHNEEFNLI